MTIGTIAVLLAKRLARWRSGPWFGLSVATGAIALSGLALTSYGVTRRVDDYLPLHLENAAGVGEALLGGAVVAGVFVWAEKRLEASLTKSAEKDQTRLRVGTAPSLANASLHGVDLSGTTLWKRNFNSADLRLANLDKTRFQGCTFESANMTDATAIGAAFEKEQQAAAGPRSEQPAVLAGAHMAGMNLHGAQFVGADLSSARLGYCNLRDAEFFGCNLTGVSFLAAELAGANFTTAVLSGAGFGTALNLDEAVFDMVSWDPARPPVWPRGFVPPIPVPLTQIENVIPGPLSLNGRDSTVNPRYP